MEQQYLTDVWENMQKRADMCKLHVKMVKSLLQEIDFRHALKWVRKFSLFIQEYSWNNSKVQELFPQVLWRELHLLEQFLHFTENIETDSIQ